MNKMKNSFFTAGIIILSLLFLQTPANADVEDVIKKSFSAQKGGTLTIDSDMGSIEILTQNQEEVAVKIIQLVKTSSKHKAEKYLEDIKVNFSINEKDVTITLDYERGHSFWKKSLVKVKFLVTVPTIYNVDLKTSGGSISVTDLTGEVLAKTSGGSLKFGVIKGPVTGRTSGGSIKLQGCEGIADVKTSGGSIRIGKVYGDITAKTSGGSVTIEQARGTVLAHTSGGSINVNEVAGDIDASTSGGSVKATITKQPQGNCRLKTSGGSVRVYMNPDIAVNLNARTSGGRVKVDFPVLIQGNISKNQLIPELNGGGPELYLRTSGGTIHIYKK